MAEYVTILIAGGFIILGVILAAAAAIILRKIARAIGLINWAESNPESESVIKRSIQFITAFVAIIILLLFVAQGLKILQLDILTGLLEVLTTSIGKWLVAFIILIAGVYVAKAAKLRVLETSIEYNQHAAVVVQFILIITFALTALEVGGIPITALLELYKVTLYTLGIMIALIIGIPVGLSLRPRLERTLKSNRDEKPKKKK